MSAPMKPLIAFLLGAVAGAVGLGAVEGVIFFWWLGQ